MVCAAALCRSGLDCTLMWVAVAVWAVCLIGMAACGIVFWWKTRR